MIRKSILALLLVATGLSAHAALNADEISVPEPKNYPMLVAGLGLMGLIARRAN